MEFKLCKKYHFYQGKLISKQNDKVYDFYLDKHDRFYSYIKPHIIAGRVPELTPLMIDTLTIPDKNKTFFSENAFSLQAIILAEYDSGQTFAFEISIDRIKITPTNVSRQSYNNDNWVLSLYKMEIPYHTDIQIVKRDS